MTRPHQHGLPHLSFLLPPIESWSDWSATFRDASLWRPVIDAISDAHGISYRNVEIPQSNTNVVFVLDRRLVLKIYSPFWSEFDIEPKLIDVLGASEAVPVPAIIASGQYHDRVPWGYLITEYRPGRTLDAVRPQITRDELLGIASQVGSVARALHETDVRLLGGIDAGEPWGDVVDRRRRAVLTELVDKGVIVPEVADTLAGILDDAVAASNGVQRVVVHGDLESDHILLKRESGEWRISSVIDFGDAKIGVRDYEWMPLWLALFHRDTEVMRTFFEAYDPGLLADDELPQRVMAWTLLHDFGTDAITWLLRKVEAPTPVESLDELRALLWPGLLTLRD